MNGAEAFELDAGADAPATVLLCHGFTGNPTSLRPWADHLHAAGFHVVCPLLPGHGTRWQDMAKTTWEDWYGELDRAMDKAASRGLPVVAGGLSMGGTLTLRLAQERGSELEGIVLVNPSVLSRKFLVNYVVPFIHPVMPSVPGIGSDIAKPGAVETSYNRVPLASVNSLRKLWRLVRADLPKITLPTRIFHSSVDHVVEPENTRVVIENIGSEDVERHLLKRSYHVATLDHDAEQIFTGTVDFITQRLSSPRA